MGYMIQSMDLGDTTNDNILRGFDLANAFTKDKRITSLINR